MLVKAQANVLTREFLNWTLLIVIVGMLSLLLSRAADGARPLSNDVPPGTLPPMEEVAKPMDSVTPMTEIPVEAAPTTENEFDLIAHLWTVLESHRRGGIDEAIAGWEGLNLPYESEVWRSVALASAFLATVNFEQAEAVLDEGLRREPNNAILHYYNSILLLTKADGTPESYDATPTPHFRFASSTPERATRTSSLYKLQAIHELETTIELAKYVNVDQRLVPQVIFADRPMIEPIGTGVANPLFVSPSEGKYDTGFYKIPMSMEPPTVADLLTAIGADNFEGKSHNILGALYLDRGLLPQAEEHMDAAVTFNMNVLDGYQELADRYGSRAQYRDAFRANLKAAGRANGILGPARKALDALRKSLK